MAQSLSALDTSVINNPSPWSHQMHIFSQLSLSVLALAALAACGGGDPAAPTSTTAAATATPAGTAAAAPSTPLNAGSAAVFLAAGVTSATYNLNDCSYTGVDSTGATIAGGTTGGTASITIDRGNTIAFSYTGTNGGTGVGNAPAINDSWSFRSARTQQFFIGRSLAGDSSYEIFADSLQGPAVNSINAIYSPSQSPTTKGQGNRVGYTSGANAGNELLCGYAVDPAFTPNFTDYNARIARAMTAVTGINNASATRTFSAGVATWDNRRSGTMTPWARLNLSTGQLAASFAQNGSYTDFNIATALSGGTAEASYKETWTDGAVAFDIAQGTSLQKFKFSVNPATQLNLTAVID